MRVRMIQPELIFVEQALDGIHKGLNSLNTLRIALFDTPRFEAIEAIYDDVFRAHAAMDKLLRRHNVVAKCISEDIPF